ncbi:MAG: 2-amino-4-hydroxy-6-hydroxymethyldihydropteridine diphosphokinase [Actinomycetota bacterium]|nr:2-amino-4-hydroxy-6-hydroxymethyldihydropteridine diphosphokinase [Actinomycetota bacterium]MDP2287735.1 2-amino-4-hydroxy-6-hydroxymethyldihydropteridine diphosphokinase [Actinomycetota bacterium]
MSSAVLGLGANLGDAIAALQGAVDALVSTAGITVNCSSAVFATEPVGGPQQPTYVNAVVLIQTTLTPMQLLQRVNAIEEQWHRTREVRWGPRTLDIDIIVFDSLVSSDPRLTLPHPRASERGFVLVPWLDADPDAELLGVPVRELVDQVDTSGVQLLDPPLELQVQS